MRKADNLPQSCAVVTKSVNLNFLEPFGPLQACNGTDLLLSQQCIIYTSVSTFSCHRDGVLYLCLVKLHKCSKLQDLELFLKKIKMSHIKLHKFLDYGCWYYRFTKLLKMLKYFVYTAMKRMSCKNSSWKPANQSKDRRIRKGKKVQSHYRPQQASNVSGGWGSQITRQSAHEGGKVVSLTHRLTLPPGNTPGTHFC